MTSLLSSLTTGLLMLLASGTILHVSVVSAAAASSLIINEVASRGTSNVGSCNDEDWIELYYGDNEEAGSSSINLSNYTLHDDKGPDDEDAKTFNKDDSNLTISSGEYLVLCKDTDFQFGIGSDDTITLLDPSGTIVSTVELSGEDYGDEETSYAYFEGEDHYMSTVTPTPGKSNLYTNPIPLEEKLKQQNIAGIDFFQFDDFDDTVKVVDFNVIMDEESLATINDHPTWEQYVPFTKVEVSNSDENNNGDDDYLTLSKNATIVASSDGGGRIRTKGQSTLSITACLQLKNVPFQIKFDPPFTGSLAEMETVYLKNHLGDSSYMRDYGSMLMLKRFGLPYSRVRPVRLYINGEYIGFYSLMEAPNQAYVMQRNFGSYDPKQTALYKMKSAMNQCPFDVRQLDALLEDTEAAEIPDPYYFERGEHRDDINFDEISGPEDCSSYFFGESFKEMEDLMKGYVLVYNETCGLTMVELGRVDRDFGPKSIDDEMIHFLDAVYYNESVVDLKPYVDADQWLKNFAAYAVTLNLDSVIMIVNNWYLATLNGGQNDWKIVQYDHNNVAHRDVSAFCAGSCGPRIIYWPILRPTCDAMDKNRVVGRILNDEESMETYLKYVQEFVDMINDTSLLDNLRKYGNEIKDYVVQDPLYLQTMFEFMSQQGMVNASEAYSYENSELSENYDDYNTPSMPFIKVMAARIEQVQAQLDSIKNGTIPRNGVYGDDEKCPDWRDPNGIDYVSGSLFDPSCGAPFCEQAAPCYEFCDPEGNFVIEECNQAGAFCDDCFPYSRCGGGLSKDDSGVFVENVTAGCGFDCMMGASCFDHKGGTCAYDGEILTVECNLADQYCKSCYPNSRCGTGRLPTVAPSLPPALVLGGGGGGDVDANVVASNNTDSTNTTAEEEEGEEETSSSSSPPILVGAVTPYVTTSMTLIIIASVVAVLS